MENNQLNSSNELSDSYKDKVIEVRPERFFTGLISVGIWQGENELGVVVVPDEVWKNKDDLMLIVNEVLIKTLNKTARWME